MSPEEPFDSFEVEEPKSQTRPTIAVDLDGVLAQYDGWQGIDHIGPPIPGVIEFMVNLRKLGRVVVYTTRTNAFNALDGDKESLVEKVKGWLEIHSIPYDEIYSEPGKPLCVAMIDDRAICCRPQENGPTEFDIALAHTKFMISRGQQKKIDWL